MAKEFFIPSQLRGEALDLVYKIIPIVISYQKQGYDMSLRQLYYQLVSKNLIKNEVSEYKRLGGIVSDARLNGWIDWDMIADRGRDRVINSHWEKPHDIIKDCESWFRVDSWKDQPWHVEVMVEKDALAGVLGPVCSRLDIPFSANRGYSSSSALYGAGSSLKRALDAGKHVRIFYLGDHDPSGQDMTRDVQERLEVFSYFYFYQPKCEPDSDEWKEAFSTMNPRRFMRYRNGEYAGQKFIVDRLALNMPQIEQYKPPPNPAKLEDTRAKKYIEEFGPDSWELDALEPSVLADIVTRNVLQYRDEEVHGKAMEIQIPAKNELKSLAEAMSKDPDGQWTPKLIRHLPRTFEDGSGI